MHDVLSDEIDIKKINVKSKSGGNCFGLYGSWLAHSCQKWSADFLKKLRKEVWENCVLFRSIFSFTFCGTLVALT